MAEEDRIREYIAVTRAHFAAYHDHKEKMAYAGTALYLTGISVLTFRKDISWINTLSCSYSILLVVAFGIISASFVIWQLFKKYYAGTIVSACDHLRLVWLKEPPTNPDTAQTYYGLIEVPQFLRTAIVNIENRLSILLPSGVTLLVVAVWTMMLYWRVERFAYK